MEADLARWAGVRDEHRAFTIAQVLADAAADHDTAALDAYRDFWVQATHTDPEAVPMLAALRDRGLRLGILSSTPWPARMARGVAAPRRRVRLFDACVWSSDLPVTKPHPEAFRAALDAVGVADPARAVSWATGPTTTSAARRRWGCGRCSCPTATSRRTSRCRWTWRRTACWRGSRTCPDLIADW